MIKFEEVKGSVPSLSLKAGDFIALNPTEIYCGAGSYILKKTYGDVLTKCTETISGDIHVAEVTTAKSTLMNIDEFKKEVVYKVFATINIESNISTVAIDELKQKIIKE